MRTGIQGFDEITEGGLPQGRTTLVMGGPGCGKTVFALQALAEEEATVVRAHLQECAVCRNEVAELSGDLALVALSQARRADRQRRHGR